MENKFSDTIMQLRYSWDTPQGKETWSQIVDRVVDNVYSISLLPKDIKDSTKEIIKQKKFIPGGRFLAQAGRPYHQTSNCFLLRCEDSREGWSDLAYKSMMMLMSGGGIGIDFSQLRPKNSPLKRNGGVSSGVIPLAKTINEIGRGVMSGGKRRSAIYNSLRWDHDDIFDFIDAKNWDKDTRKIKETNFDFPAPLDMTNISVILNKEFFDSYKNIKSSKHELATKVYSKVIKNMVKKSEPGFQIDYNNPNESLRNAPIHPNTYVLSSNGYVRVGDIINEEITIWTGKQWVNTVFKKTKEYSPTLNIKLSGDRNIICDPDHEFILENNTRIKAKDLKHNDNLLISLPNTDIPKNKWTEENKLFYTLGYGYGDGSFDKKYPRLGITFCTNESKECVKYLYSDISIREKDLRGYTRIYTKNNELFRDRNKYTFPHDLFSVNIENKVAFIAGLFDSDGNYEPTQHRIRLASKNKEFLHGVRRLLESLGILSGINKAGISTYGNKLGYLLCINGEYINKFIQMIPTIRIKPETYKPSRKTKIKVIDIKDSEYSDVFCCDVKVDEHSFMAEGVIISNCTEIVSEDDSDVCVLGSINFANIKDIQELETVTELATLFLLLGTEYTDRPTSKVKEVQVKNRRLGLGLMGLHEWLIARNKKYGRDIELAHWLSYWKNKSVEASIKWSKKLNFNTPIATRAVAPNGSISIIGETTSGIEPIFAVAYKRRFLSPEGWKYQYVIDPVAERLIENGIKPEKIEDAYTLSLDPERRIDFQCFIQEYVDNAISSTINLPTYGQNGNNDHEKFGKMLFDYLPKLRGITCFADGSRGNGQPLSVVDYEYAMKHKNKVFESNDESCIGGICGI